MTVPQQTVINHSLTCTVMSSRNHKSPWQLLQRRNFPIWWTVGYLSSISVHPQIGQTDLHVQSPTTCGQYSHTHHATMHHSSVMPSVSQLANGRSADHHILTVPPQDQLELKESSMLSQAPRPDKGVKDGTLHITSTPRPTACLFLSGVT